MTKNVAVVGVGRMGANMARRLKERGHPVTAVYDTDTARALALAAELGCQAPQTLPEVTAAADVVLTVVSDDAAMSALFASPGAGLLVAAENTTFINCATVHPDTHVRAAQAAVAAGACAIEACMASSMTQAREGTLFLMVGGDRKDFDRVTPLLNDLASSVRFIGQAGSAAQVKALVNMVMNCNTAALAEGLGLGSALGIDLDLLMEIFAATGAASRVLSTDGPDMKNRDHECFFSAAHAAKDSGIANALARQAGVRVPLSEATALQYLECVELGYGDLDKSAIAELTFLGRGGRKE